MVCLDSDIIGILLALLTVVLPAIIKAFDNGKKKDNDVLNSRNPNRKKEELDALFEEFLGKEDSKYSADDEDSHHIVMYEEELPEQHFAGPSQMETYIEEFRSGRAGLRNLW